LRLEGIGVVSISTLPSADGTVVKDTVSDTDGIVARRCRNEEEPAAAIQYTQRNILSVLEEALVVNNQM
jgi:hypothetical protein